MTTPIAAQIPSGSSDGRPIAVAATASPGTTLHAATNTSGQVDEIWVTAWNVDTVARELTIELGGSSTSDQLVVSIPARSGGVLVVNGARLAGGVAVKAFAASASKINCVVTVNRVG